MNKGRFGQLSARWLAVALIASATACSGVPVAPDNAAPPKGSNGAAAATVAASPGAEMAVSVQSAVDSKLGFDVASGAFTIHSGDGDFSGSYVGRVTVSSSARNRTDASLSLQVTSGTGAFAGAAGSLTGDGVGAFLGEGTFSLSLKGTIVTAANPKGFRVQGTVSGTTSLSCVSPNLYAALSGDGALGVIGAAHAALTHLIVNSACLP